MEDPEMPAGACDEAMGEYINGTSFLLALSQCDPPGITEDNAFFQHTVVLVSDRPASLPLVHGYGGSTGSGYVHIQFQS